MEALFLYYNLCLRAIMDSLPFSFTFRGHRGRDRMVVGLTTTYAISTYHH